MFIAGMSVPENWPAYPPGRAASRLIWGTLPVGERRAHARVARGRRITEPHHAPY